MQQLVRTALHELVIDILHGGVLLRNLQLARLVRLEDGLAALRLAGVRCGRLAAAADAAVRAGHDLNEVEVLLAAFDLRDQLVGVAETVRHGDAKLEIARRNLEGLDAVESAHAALGDGLERIGRSVVQHVANDRLRDAARDAEDDARAGVIAQRIVRLGVRQVRKVDAGRLNHANQLVCGEHEIDQALAVLLQLGTLCLEFLGGAGHDGDGVDVLVFELLADDRAEHLHRAAGRRDLRHQIRMRMLHVLDPAGAAGGEHRQLRAGLDLFEELGRLFQDGEVGGKVRVIHHIDAETAQRGDELAGDRRVGGHPEFLGYAGADRRGVLHHDALALVVNHIPHLRDLAVDRDRARRAHGGALAAANAVGLRQHLAEARRDEGALAAVGEVNRADVLHLGAHAHAQTAQNALGRIARDARRRHVQPLAGIGVFAVRRLLHVVAVRVFLQLALAALLAGKALGAVAAHQKLESVDMARRQPQV